MSLKVIDETPTGKRPPHDRRAEMSVLGCLLISPDVYPDVDAVLAVDDFFFPGNREVYDAIRFLVEDSCPIDVIALSHELHKRGQLQRLENGEGYLLDLSNAVPTAHNVGHYVRMVKQCSQMRRLIAVCAEIQSRAYGDFG